MIDWDAVSRELVAFFVALNETDKDIQLDTPKLGLLTRPATWVPMRQGSCAAPPSEKRSTVYPDSAEIRKNPLPTALKAILLHP
jgi:hypothetical protein